MSGPQEPQSGRRDGETAGPSWIVIAITGAVALSIVVGILFGPEALEQLLFGWLYLPWNAVSRMTVEWPVIGLGAVCGAVYLGLLHRILRWWRVSQAARQPLGDEPATTGWRFRSTCQVALRPVLLFAAGIAMVGVTHQIIWLSQSAFTAADSGSDSKAFGLVANARDAAWRSTFRLHLKQWGIAARNFEDTFNHLPVGGTFDDRGRLLHGWAVALGPQIPFSTMDVDFSKPWNVPPNDRLFQCAMGVFLNPSLSQVFDSEGYGLSHLAANRHVMPLVEVPFGESGNPVNVAGHDEPARGKRSSRTQKPPGNILLFGQVVSQFKPWAHPAKVRDPALGLNRRPDGFGSLPGNEGVPFVLVDGSVRELNPNIDASVLRAISIPDAGSGSDSAD